MTTASASENPSRYVGSSMAVSSGRPQRLCVYQDGRGHDPVVVAARGRSLVVGKATRRAPFSPLVVELVSVSRHSDRNQCALAISGVGPLADLGKLANHVRF